MEKKEFKAESRRLLDLMINSIYTHKEIFLRELISNASDAIDKLYFKSLTDDKVGLNKDDFAIEIKIDKTARTLKISDNGIGMTEEEVENYITQIAFSGASDFLAKYEKAGGDGIIGHFGLGFYSAFMVSENVEIFTKSYKDVPAVHWQSDGNAT